MSAMRRLWSWISGPLERIKDGLTEVQWDLLRGALVVGALGVVGAAVYFVGGPLWRRWENRQALAQAAAFEEKRDYRSMVLALRRATELEPVDYATWLEAERELAEIGSPDALVADEQLTRLSPNDISLRLALIQDALRFGRVDTAAQQLAGLSDAAKRDIAFHRLAAALAAAQGRRADYEKELASVIAADPQNLNARFTYASLRLWSSDRIVSAAARADLDGMLTEPTLRVRAAIELLMEAGRERDAPAMSHLLIRLMQLFAPGTPADFAEKNPPGWTALLNGLKRAALDSPTDAALMARWLTDLGRGEEALLWIGQLPDADRNAPIVMDVAAELNASAGHLGALDILLRRGAWGDLTEDTVTLAIASRVEVLRYDAARGRATWNDAIAACGSSTLAIRSMARLAELWKDSAGRIVALQAALAQDPAANWAFQALRNDDIARRDLSALWQLYDQRRQHLPNDQALAAEWILLGCVLNRATPDAYNQADAMRAADANSRLIAIADVAALWRRHRLDAAWAVLTSFSAQERVQPSIAFWVAVVQADRGHAQEAVEALADAYKRSWSQPERLLLVKAASEAGYDEPPD